MHLDCPALGSSDCLPVAHLTVGLAEQGSLLAVRCGSCLQNSRSAHLCAAATALGHRGFLWLDDAPALSAT